MKLKIDLSAVWGEVRSMGAQPIDFRLDLQPLFSYGKYSEFQKTSSELRHGKEVKIKDVESKGGLLNYKGHQVLLYIPYEPAYDVAVNDPSQAHKFHVAECSTIREMRMGGRIERYVATTDHSGLFPSYTEVKGVEKKFLLRRLVCRNCLNELNYKGSAEYGTSSMNAASFSIQEFFDIYSPLFTVLPPPRKVSAQDDRYPDEWSEISRKIRAESGWKCSECGVDVHDHQYLLHVHHKNGNKGDVSRRNLVCLCAVCHRRQSHHEHMKISLTEIRLIHRLRRIQKISYGLNDPMDTAFDGIFGLAEKAGWGIPEGPFKIKGRYVDMLWNEKHYAVDMMSNKNTSLQGWTIFSIDGVYRRLHEELK